MTTAIDPAALKKRVFDDATHICHLVQKHLPASPTIGQKLKAFMVAKTGKSLTQIADKESTPSAAEAALVAAIRKHLDVDEGVPDLAFFNLDAAPPPEAPPAPPAGKATKATKPAALKTAADEAAAPPAEKDVADDDERIAAVTSNLAIILKRAARPAVAVPAVPAITEERIREIVAEELRRRFS